jgi:hypothetical protein
MRSWKVKSISWRLRMKRLRNKLSVWRMPREQ